MANTSGKYHITNRGDVALCRAVNQCPLSSDGHFDTPQAGQQAFEKKMASAKIPKNRRASDTHSPAAVMVAHAASGAAGVHADQKAKKKSAAGRTNRVGSRSSAKRAIMKDFE